jgi:hypothetical protein
LTAPQLTTIELENKAEAAAIDGILPLRSFLETLGPRGCVGAFQDAADDIGHALRVEDDGCTRIGLAMPEGSAELPRLRFRGETREGGFQTHPRSSTRAGECAELRARRQHGSPAVCHKG